MNITVFTATYNRATFLARIYKSLMQQTFKDFEWVIVDDGSTDTTPLVVEEFIQENILKIKYFKQDNKGKHIAINNGVSKAEGKLFLMLDSDDILPADALENVEIQYQVAKGLKNFGGVIGRKAFFNGEFVSSLLEQNEIMINYLNFRYTLKIKGDFAEVFLTDVMKEFPFPEIPQEKFCPEALIWNRIASKYNLYLFNKTIYNCEYLEGGLTSNIVKIRMNSPKATMLHYSELEKYKIPFIQKIKANINFWRFAFCSEISFLEKGKMINIVSSIIGLPLGFAMHLSDKRKVK